MDVPVLIQSVSRRIALFEAFRDGLDLHRLAKGVSIGWGFWDCGKGKRVFPFRFETPLLNHQGFRHNGDCSGYFRISIGNPARPDLCKFGKEGANRLEEMKIRPPSKSISYIPGRGHIVYVLQTPGDKSLAGRNQLLRASDDIQHIRALTNVPLYVVDHPDRRCGISRIQGKYGGTEGLYSRLRASCKKAGAKLVAGPSCQYLHGCGAVVTYSSGTGVEFILKGVPVIALLPSSYLWGAVPDNLQVLASQWKIESSVISRRLSRIAFCEWTMDEATSGKAQDSFSHIIYS